jgi:hypothetical protein
MAKTRLRYHAAAAREFYGTDQRSRVTSAAQVRALARRIGRPLPAALREWIAYFGDLGLCSGQDRAISLDQLGAPITGGRDIRIDYVPRGYLPLMRENQGCCLWALVLDGSDDPPVVQSENWHKETPDWQPVADRFSNFTHARVWSQACAFRSPFWWMSLEGDFGPRMQAYLRARYREGPTTTDWPCGVHHHFERGGAYLWVMDSQWMAGAVEEQALEELTRDVWWLVRGNLEAWEQHTVGPMLRQLRAAPPVYPGPGWESVFGDDLGARLGNDCWLSSGSDDALVPPALDELLDHFHEIQRRTPGTGLTAHWLERDRQRLYIVTQDYRQKEANAAWWLHADSEEELEQLLRHVGRWGQLHKTLSARTEPGKRVLARMRETRGA